MEWGQGPATTENGHLPTHLVQGLFLCSPRCPSNGWRWSPFSADGSPTRVMCGAMVCVGECWEGWTRSHGPVHGRDVGERMRINGDTSAYMWDRREVLPVPQSARVCTCPRDWGRLRVAPDSSNTPSPPPPRVPGSWTEPLGLTLKLLLLPLSLPRCDCMGADDFWGQTL